jgi:ABC-type sugar transport system ATPase subunit
VTESRKFDGLFFNFEAPPNISIANLSAVMRKGLIQSRKEDQVSLSYLDKLNISPDSQTKLVGLLSGGNQQKVILSRWLFSQPDIFILDEPTKGIDIGTKIALYHLVNELTAENRGVILISSDHDELLAMSDRIGIVRDGRIVQIADAKDLRHEDLVQGSVEKPLSKRN